MSLDHEAFGGSLVCEPGLPSGQWYPPLPSGTHLCPRSLAAHGGRKEERRGDQRYPSQKQKMSGPPFTAKKPLLCLPSSHLPINAVIIISWHYNTPNQLSLYLHYRPLQASVPTHAPGCLHAWNEHNAYLVCKTPGTTAKVFD